MKWKRSEREDEREELGVWLAVTESFRRIGSYGMATCTDWAKDSQILRIRGEERETEELWDVGVGSKLGDKILGHVLTHQLQKPFLSLSFGVCVWAGGRFERI